MIQALRWGKEFVFQAASSSAKQVMYGHRGTNSTNGASNFEIRYECIRRSLDFVLTAVGSIRKSMLDNDLHNATGYQ